MELVTIHKMIYSGPRKELRYKVPLANISPKTILEVSITHDKIKSFCYRFYFLSNQIIDSKLNSLHFEIDDQNFPTSIKWDNTNPTPIDPLKSDSPSFHPKKLLLIQNGFVIALGETNKLLNIGLRWLTGYSDGGYPNLGGNPRWFIYNMYLVPSLLTTLSIVPNTALGFQNIQEAQRLIKDQADVLQTTDLY